MAHRNCADHAPNFQMCISELQDTFNERFRDFRLQEENIVFVAQPFSVNSKGAPTDFQLELLDLQCDEFVKKSLTSLQWINSIANMYLLTGA